MFKSENDVRRWLKRQGPVWWVENKRGGSPGFPDAIVARSAIALFLELKLASGREGCGWTLEAAPGQLMALQALSSAGLVAWLIAGLEGTDELGALEAGRGLVRISESKGIGRRGLYRAERWDVRWKAGDGLPLGPGAKSLKNKGSLRIV